MKDSEVPRAPPLASLGSGTLGMTTFLLSLSGKQGTANRTFHFLSFKPSASLPASLVLTPCPLSLRERGNETHPRFPLSRRERDQGVRTKRGVGIKGNAGSITRVLVQVRVRHQLGRRNRIQVEVRIGRAAGLRAALPRPDVAPAREQAKPYQVGTAMRFPQQLAAALGEQKRQRQLAVRDHAGRIAVRAHPQLVDVV